MGNYHTDNALGGTQQAMSSSYKTVIEVLAQTTGIKRNRVYGFNIGPSGNPASTDTDLQADISRATATATATAATPLPTDPNEGAATGASKVNATVEGTVTATSSLWYAAMNQRGTFTWQTNDFGQMLVGPATNNAGLVLRAKSAGGYTSSVGAGWFVNE